MDFDKEHEEITSKALQNILLVLSLTIIILFIYFNILVADR